MQKEAKMLTIPHVICYKVNSGTQVRHSDGRLWLTIDKRHSNCPDYRNKRIMLDGYMWPILWDKGKLTK